MHEKVNNIIISIESRGGFKDQSISNRFAEYSINLAFYSYRKSWFLD